MIPCITEGTICYPAGYLDLKSEDISEILLESMWLGKGENVYVAIFDKISVSYKYYLYLCKQQ